MVGALGAIVEGARTLGPPSFGHVLAVNVMELVGILAFLASLRRRGGSMQRLRVGGSNKNARATYYISAEPGVGP